MWVKIPAPCILIENNFNFGNDEYGYHLSIDNAHKLLFAAGDGLGDHNAGV